MASPFRIRDIRQGSLGSNPYLYSAETFGGRLFFIAGDDGAGREIWSTDGTTNGTRLLKDISPDPGDSHSFRAVIGNRLFFNAADANGYEPWVTDGTSAGTFILKDIAPGTFPFTPPRPRGSLTSDFTKLGSTVVFFAFASGGQGGSQLWKTDGTPSGTQLVQSFGNSFDDETFAVGVVGDQLLFWAKDGNRGRELWGVDGSLSPRPIKDINPGAADGDPGSSSFAYSMRTALGERLFFSATAGPTGEEMWVSDGTAAGTRLLKDISPGTAGTYLFDPTALGNQLYALARNGVTNSSELWRSDGSPNGTTLVKRFDLGGASSSSFNYSIVAAVGGNLFIDVTSPNQGRQLWISNGTTDGTKLLKLINPGNSGGTGSNSFSYRIKTVTVGNKLFFTANDGRSGLELWVSDGTSAGTRQVKDIREGSASSISPFNTSLTAAANQVFFWANDGITGNELWRSDGTFSGTQQVADIKLGPEGSDINNYTANSSDFDYGIKVLGDNLIFSANDGIFGPELWGLNLSDPAPPTLALGVLSASKAEGRTSSTPFTFEVTRSGNTTGVARVRWAVSSGRITAATANDFTGNVLPSGSVSFAKGQVSQTIVVNVAGDLTQEVNETFRVTLSAPTGATLTRATATGAILNDDLIGDRNRNRLVGTARAEFLDGRANVDTLTGGGAADAFGFRFGESPLSAPDVVTDFAFGTDKIDLLTASGGALPAPVKFSRAANNSTATSLGSLAAAVYADADGALRGNQALAANGAVLVQATNQSIQGTYLVVNNSVAGRSDRDDVMIKLNALTGALPPLGVTPINSVFL